MFCQICSLFCCCSCGVEFEFECIWLDSKRWRSMEAPPSAREPIGLRAGGSSSASRNVHLFGNKHHPATLLVAIEPQAPFFSTSQYLSFSLAVRPCSANRLLFVGLLEITQSHPWTAINHLVSIITSPKRGLSRIIPIGNQWVWGALVEGPRGILYQASRPLPHCFLWCLRRKIL